MLFWDAAERGNAALPGRTEEVVPLETLKKAGIPDLELTLDPIQFVTLP